MRPISYYEKKRQNALLIAMIVLVLALILLVILFGGTDDRWVCEYGQWVKYGQPSEPMPLTPCE